MVPTRSGRTARLVSAHRPRVPVLAVSPRIETVRRLNLLFGVRCMIADDWEGPTALLDDCARLAKETGVAKSGDLIGITAGLPEQELGTNLFEVHRVPYARRSPRTKPSPAIVEAADLVDFAALEQQWAEAVRDRDIRFLERLLAPEFTPTNGRRPNPVRGREEYLEITESRYVVTEFEFERIEALEYRDAAVVRSRYRQRGSMDGETHQTFLITDVFVRVDERWLAATRHVSPM